MQKGITKMFTKLKCKCGSESFFIEKSDTCEGCIHNGADSGLSENEDSPHFDSGYVYDPKIIEELMIDRDRAENCGECELGCAEGAGCHVYTCSSCGNLKEHIFIMGNG